MGTATSVNLDSPSEGTPKPHRASGLLEALGPNLKKYLPAYKWTATAVDKCLDKPNMSFPDDRPKGLDGWRDWYVFVCITLATVFAMVSKSLCTDSNTASISDASLEIAIYPDLVSNHDRRELLRQLFIDMRESLNIRGEYGVLPLGRWIRMVFNVCTREPLESVPWSKDGLLGYHANGVFVIMDILLRPSLQPISLINFHIQLGQPLEIPVSERGFVVSYIASGPRPKNTVKIDTKEFPDIDVMTTRESDQKVRIDLEPYWEGDARKVVFRARVGGLVKCTFSPLRLINDIAAFARGEFLDSDIQIIGCRCGIPLTTFPIPRTEKWEKWKIVEMSQLLKTTASSPLGIFGDENCLYPMKQEDGSSDLLYLHAAKDCLAQLLACVCFWRAPKIVAIDCLSCAFRHWVTEVRTRDTRWKREYELGAVLINAIESLPQDSDMGTEH